MFQAKVGGKFAALYILDSKIDTLANSLKEGLLSTAEEVLGREKMKIQPWVKNEVLDLCNQREQWKQTYTSTEAGLRVQRSEQEERGSKGRADCGAVEEHRRGDVRNSTLKALTMSQQQKSAVIEDSSGNILTAQIF